MKKFLKLKKSIIQSKEEPLLTQVYIDSIRSSCYKLVQPHSSIFSSLSTQSIHQRAVYENQAQNSMHSIKQYKSKIQNIIETLQSACKSNNNEDNNDEEIIKVILDQLDILQSKSAYKQPVYLIRKIIQKLPNSKEHTKVTESSSSNKQANQIYFTQKNEYHEQIQKQNLDNNFESTIPMKNSLLQKFKHAESYGSVQSNSHSKICTKIYYKTYSPQQQVQGQSIFLDAQSENDNSQNTFSQSNSDINLQILSGLQKITQKDEQQESVVSDVSHNTNSLQIKKIMYLLQSSTKKKILQQSTNSSFSKCAKKLLLNAYSPDRTDKTISRASSILQSSRSSMKQSIDNRSDKTKTIKDIVKLLDTKYNRTIKFHR